MHFFEAMPLTSVTLSVLLSGLLSALIASGVNAWWSGRLDAANKEWALKAELRRFRVTRIATATNGLRQCFFVGKTQLEFNLVAVTGIEKEIAAFKQREVPNTSTSDGVTRDQYNREQSELSRRYHGEIIRFNDRIGSIQADAKAHVAILLNEPLFEDYWEPMQVLLSNLSQGHEGTSQGIRERIAVYDQNQAEVIRLLKEADQLIADEIAKPL